MMCFSDDVSQFLFPTVFICPFLNRSRNKRVSDQRLAELETLLALARLKGRFANVQVGYGFINPNKIGRKKRGVNDQQLQLGNSKSTSSDGLLIEDGEQSDDYWFLKPSPVVNQNGPLENANFSTWWMESDWEVLGHF